MHFKKHKEKSYDLNKTSLIQNIGTDRIILAVFLLGLIIRLLYIMGTDYTQRQHDLYTFEEMKGHAGYIGHLLQNMALPDFDPRQVIQFYHPPLHHILSAIWMKVILFSGAPFEQAAECLQVLTVIYSMIFLIYTDKIFQILGLKGEGRILAFTVTAFHPTFIIMSGSINNDMLSITLTQIAVYYSLQWFDTVRIRDILLTGTFLGLAMMTKLSAGLAAAAIGVIFLIKLADPKQKKSRLILQFGGFAAVCFPLALWWGIRNAVRFDVPFGYVPSLGDGSHQFIGNYTPFERLLDFSSYQFRSVYVAWGDPYFEHNIFIGLLKTSAFGEQTLSPTEGWIYLFAVILFITNVLLAVLVMISKAVILRDKNNMLRREHKFFIFVYFITVLLSFIQFCFAYPHTCTQNIRYATPLIWIGALFMGLVFSKLKESGRKIYPAYTAVVTAFSAASVIFYITLIADKVF